MGRILKNRERIAAQRARLPHKEKESFQEEAAYRKKTAFIRQPRKITVRGEENKKESKVLPLLREIISVYES